MIIPVNYGEFTFHFTGTGLPNGADVVIGFLDSTALTPAALAAEALDNWGDNILPNQTSAINLVEVRCKKGPNATGNFGVATAARAGGIATAGATPNVAFLVTKQTALGGREGRGRMYIPGASEAAFGSDGAIDSTVQANLQADVDAFAARADTQLYDFFLLHSSVGTAPTPITSWVVSGLAATQRRRLRP